MRRIFTFLFALLASTGIFAQEVIQAHFDGTTGSPTFLKFSEQSAVALSQAPQLLKQQLDAPADVDFVRYSKEKDPVYGILERYQEYYKGIKVEHARYYVHAKDGKIISVNGDFRKLENLNVNPSISEEAALEKALNKIGAQKYMWEDPKNEEFARTTEPTGTFKPQAELVIINNYDRSNREEFMKPRLAYKFNIYAEKPLSRDFVYVDAQTGKVIYTDPIIKHAHGHEHSLSGSAGINSTKSTTSVGTAATRYSGTQSIETQAYNGAYRLREYTRGNGIETYDMNTGTNYNSAVDFTDNDNNWSAAEWDNAAKDNAALDAHWGAEMTYDYWSTKHGRNSYDGNGAAIKSYVHYDKNYDNAYWNGSVMTYGDGSGTYFDALTALDVCAHEIGHAVCENTANLTYSNESGAMNEGFSDIWGASVEYFAAPNKSTWLIGEDIERRSGHAALRSMADPKSEGQPDTYGGTNWYTGTADNGGVHTNSGVLNHWYYLLSVGGSGTNDLGNSYNVTGIGIDKAAKIAFRTESVYLTASSNYANARDLSIQAATDLYGAGSAEVIATTNAWYAVGVGAAYGTVSYCTSKGNNSSYEWISNVTIGSFSNASGAAGYTDFTSKTVTLNAGQAYSVSLSPSFSGSSYNEYFKIWVDLNADGDFADAGELVFDAGSMSKTTVTGSLTIPAGTAATTTRMRVSMKYNGAPTACETFSYGEVEDYTCNIVAGTADTQAPSAPSGLAASNVTQTTVDLSWNASTDNVGVTGYDVYKDGAFFGSVTGTSAQVTGLTANTTYSFYVKAKDVAGNISAASNTVNVTTLSGSTGGGMPTGYCSSNGSNATYEWIDLVQLGSINNATGSNGGYADFTNLSTNVTRGVSYTLTISAGFKSTSYTEYWTIYIDWNRDGDFNDAGEEVDKGSSSSSGNLTSTFTVPSTASLGTTRMRISMKYNAYQTACETFSYGEVEDYALVVGTAFAYTGDALASENPLTDNGEVNTVSLYPNPFGNELNINIPFQSENVSYQILNMQGQLVQTDKLNSNISRINTSNLPKGMYTIRFFDGQKTIVQKITKQ